MFHLKEDWGVSATIATLVIVGAYALLWKGVSTSLETALVGIVSATVTAFVVIKSGKKPKE